MVHRSFIQDLTEEEYGLLAHLFEPVEAEARATIVKQGERAQHFYLIMDGKVDLRYKPYDGPKITLTHLHVGDMFGWSAVVGHATYTSDAISSTTVKLVRLRGDDLRRLCVDHPAEGSHILEKLAESVSPRWVHARKQIQGFLQQSLQAI